MFLDLGNAAFVILNSLTSASQFAIVFITVYMLTFLNGMIILKYDYSQHYYCRINQYIKIIVIWALNQDQACIFIFTVIIQLIGLSGLAKSHFDLTFFILLIAIIHTFTPNGIDMNISSYCRIIQLLLCIVYLIVKKGSQLNNMNIQNKNSYFPAVQLDEISKEYNTVSKTNVITKSQFEWLKFESYLELNQQNEIKQMNMDLKSLFLGEIRDDTDYLLQKLLMCKISVLRVSSKDYRSGSLTKLTDQTILDLLEVLKESDQKENMYLWCQLSSQDCFNKLIHIFITKDINGDHLTILYFQNLQGIKVQQNLLQDICHSISHEFGTNLNCISTLAHTSYDSEEISNEFKLNIIQPIVQSTEILKLITQNIRDYGFLQTHQFDLKLDEVDLAQEIDDILALHKNCLIAKQIEILFEEDPLFILTDRCRFRQIFYQLFSNALRYTNQGAINVKLLKQRESIVVVVEDTGIGMSQIEQEHLQQLLTHNQLTNVSCNSVGSGLGLYISNQILKQLNDDQNSSIQFTSDPEFGSSFSFILQNHSVRLQSDHNLKVRTFQRSNYTIVQFSNANFYFESIQPIPDNPMRATTVIQSLRTLVHNQSASISFTSQSNSVKYRASPVPKFETQTTYRQWTKFLDQTCCAKVLCVDDEYFNILALKAILRRFELQSDYAFNGEDAIKKVLQHKDKQCQTCGNCSYKLIFLDINMPIKDGFQTVKELKIMMENKSIPPALCIANTAFTDIETKIRAIDAGMDYFITKPINIHQITEIIQTCQNK